MAFGLGRLCAAPLLLLNFLMYAVVCGLAGWALNFAINYGWEELSDCPVTFYFVIFSLIAGVVGVASKFTGAHHVRSWQVETVAGSSAAASIAWLLTLLALGVAIKQILWGGVYDERLIALEAFIIILAVTQFFYLLALHGRVWPRWRFYGRRREQPYAGSPPPAPKDLPPA